MGEPEHFDATVNVETTGQLETFLALFRLPRGSVRVGEQLHVVRASIVLDGAASQDAGRDPADVLGMDILPD